ncbi:hypothetical protein [Nocardia sp. MDA0666]|uniref:acyl-CoA-like ligand-binding transcription factor n=1 Tax=Nocardia sp. MDA0666 TaxID=2135448 RepID=UPI00351675F6
MRDLLAQVAGHCALGVAIAGYEHWLDHPDQELTDILDRALRSWGPDSAPSRRPRRKST